MPVKATYKGPKRDVGVFGIIQSGDQVMMTDKEAACIRSTPDILKWWEFDRKGGGPAVNTFTETPEQPGKETPPMVEQRLRSDSAERQRLDRLAAVNDPRSVEQRELSAKSFPELTVLVQQLRSEGKTVEIEPGMGQREIVQLILDAKYPRDGAR